MASKRDFPAKKSVKGRKIMQNDNATLVRAATPRQDLPVKKTVKGGKVVANDNITLIGTINRG